MTDRAVATITIVMFAVIAFGLLSVQKDQRERAEAAEARVSVLEAELEAARDSVLAGEVEGFGLRCYLVRED